MAYLVETSHAMGCFEEHQRPFKTSKCCTALCYVILKGSQKLLSYRCFIFPKGSFIILMIWHNHLKGKPPKKFITAFFFHSSIMQWLLSLFHEQPSPVACGHGSNKTPWASLSTFLEHRSNHPWCAEQLHLLGLFSSILHRDHTTNSSTGLSYLTEMLCNFRQFWLMP